jgi:lipoprotein-releasing system permease protein
VTIGLRYFSSTRGLLVSFISMLALSGLALGVGLLIVVLSVMNGFDREMRENILSIVPHVQLISANNMSDWRAHRQQIISSEQVVEAVPFNRVQGLAFSQQQTRPIEVLGLSAEAVPKGFDKLLSNGGLTVPEFSELLLAEPLAKSLNVSVGDTVKLVFPSDGNRHVQLYSFNLKGVFSTHTEIDQVLAIASLSQVGQILGIGDYIQGFRVQVSNELDARAIGYELLATLPSEYGFRDWFQSHGNLYQAIQLSKKLVALLIFLIVGIAAFNVVSMLMMSVIDKRRDIAILHTLGLSQRQILQVFLVQGGLIGALGIALGVLLGLLGCYGISDLILGLESLLGSKFLNTAVYPIDYIPLDMRWLDIILISTVAFCLTLLATVYPAVRASRTVPAEELRYDL